MKKRYWLLILLILMSVIGTLNSCQKDKKKIINVYVEPEIENYTQKLLGRYEKINEDTEIKLNLALEYTNSLMMPSKKQKNPELQNKNFLIKD